MSPATRRRPAPTNAPRRGSSLARSSDRPGPRRIVPVGHQHAGILAKDLGDPPGLGAGDGDSGGHRFQEHEPERLPLGGEDETPELHGIRPGTPPGPRGARGTSAPGPPPTRSRGSRDRRALPSRGPRTPATAVRRPEGVRARGRSSADPCSTRSGRRRAGNGRAGPGAVGRGRGCPIPRGRPRGGSRALGRRGRTPERGGPRARSPPRAPGRPGRRSSRTGGPALAGGPVSRGPRGGRPDGSGSRRSSGVPRRRATAAAWRTCP